MLIISRADHPRIAIVQKTQILNAIGFVKIPESVIFNIVSAESISEGANPKIALIIKLEQCYEITW